MLQDRGIIELFTKTSLNLKQANKSEINVYVSTSYLHEMFTDSEHALQKMISHCIVT